MQHMPWAFIERPAKIAGALCIALLVLGGILIGLNGCGGSSGGGDSTTGADSKQCEILDEQCWTCEDNTVQTDPACTNAVSCTGSEDFWECINITTGEYSACEQAIDRACYDATTDSVCMRAWESCAATPCEAASAKAWACDQQVLFQNPVCAGASQCFWDEDMWTCIADALGDYSQCELTLSATCYEEGSPSEEYWKTCYPDHYACSKQTLAMCTAWLLEQPASNANDRQLIQACQTSEYLYSDACYQQFDQMSDPAWDTLFSRTDCQFDACDYLLN